MGGEPQTLVQTESSPSLPLFIQASPTGQLERLARLRPPYLLHHQSIAYGRHYLPPLPTLPRAGPVLPSTTFKV